MSRLTDLLNQLKQNDPRLAKDLEQEFKALSSRRAFGLNFERHRPENVELYERTVRRGDKVRILPPCGEVSKTEKRLWEVKGFERHGESRLAHLELLRSNELRIEKVPVSELVVVAEFRDYIYPGLISTDRVERSLDKPFHSVINGENYHALNALTFTHHGKVDLIYIDPPYNTGAKDWKYNNDYVESEDLYRHSKWLAFIDRRLKVAKKLLNPENSVLIVTIDEKEYLRLGLLLEQIFPEARIQMVSSVINPKGATRSSAFGRTDEYIFFVMFGGSSPSPLPLDIEWKVVRDRRAEGLRWAELLRSGSNTLRSDSPNQFYPIFIRNCTDGPVFDSIGEPYFGKDLKSVPVPGGCVPIWPIRSNGTEGNWQNSASNLRELIKKGYAKIGRWRAEKTSITYLKRGEQQKVETGVFPVIGRKQDNSVIVDESNYTPVFIPGTQWRISSHNAEQGGTNLQKLMMPDRKFPYPKSLYAVEDALRFFVANNPDAIILDFFAGSGTTAHAVMRINRLDDGRRQSISITNNEVSANEQKSLVKEGLRPGDPAWEKMGICEYITKPRIRAVITGKTPCGEDIQGDYKFTDQFPISEGFPENAEFFTLSYESEELVEHNMSFKNVAPLLWLRAGSKGRRLDAIPEKGWDVADTYGVLEKLDQANRFCDEVLKISSIQVVYIITDDERRFQSIIKHLPDHIEPVRLYESYLTNFQFSNGE